MLDITKVKTRLGWKPRLDAKNCAILTSDWYKKYKTQDVYSLCVEEIEKFILNVINGVDPMREKRTRFVNDVLMPKGSPSQNIINDILDSIDNQILYRN